jgi:putative spermidine/putrescine transport system permease protein
MTLSAVPAGRSSRGRWTFDTVLLAVPVAFLTLMLVVPLARMVMMSFGGPSPLALYADVLTDGVFLRSFIRTVLVCAAATGLCLLIGFPLAFEITRPPSFRRKLVFGILLLTLWISILVRTYSWILILQRTGVVNATLIGLHVISQPLPLVRNMFGILVGMVHVLLPYMVLALVPPMQALDRGLLRAAWTLGAGRARTMMTVVLPSIMGGIVAGCLLTFILGLAFFVTPAILGGPSNIFVSQLIARQILQFQKFGEAAAMGVILTGSVLILYLLLMQFSNPLRIFGSEDR